LEELKMANMTIDFSNVQGNVVLEEGTYVVNLEAAEMGTSASGKEMLKVRFKEPESGAAIFENYLLQENCLWKLKELLSAAGYEATGAVDFDPADLVGLSFKAKVIKDNYNDSDVNRIKKIFAA
jgi:hypothetical protein